MRMMLVVGLAMGIPVAHAERTTTVTVGAMFGGAETRVDEAVKMKPVGGPRITLAWEHAPPPQPATRGVTVDLAFVPELTAGALLGERTGEVLLGVGARADIRMAQRDGGLFRVNARFAVYVAARLLVIGGNQDTAIEGAVGEYIYLGARRVRLGGEIGVMTREQTTTNYAPSREIGVFASAYLGFAM